MVNSCNYPPEEILKPIIGKPNYEYIILWILSNNEVCSWSDLKKKVNKSTLSIYLNKLKQEGSILKSEFNQYRITKKGREKYYRLSQDKKGKRKLSYPPDVILRQRNYDHWILWMVYNNNYCVWSDFLEDPLSINQSSLSKNLNRLIENGFVAKDNKEYKITRIGKTEYSQMLTDYDLDRQSILEEESKRIAELTQKTLNFFERFEIGDREVQFRFLYSVLRLDYDRIKTVLRDEDDFHKILLYLAFNHPNEYPKFISTEEFSKKYDIKMTTLEYYIDQIVENQIYPIKFFKLVVPPENVYYFQSDEKLEMMLRVITEEHITKFTYLNKLFENSSDLVLPLDMNSTVNAILEEACQVLFNEELKIPLKKFLPEYINYLAFKIEKKKALIGISDKLAGIIWQDIPEILQTGISKTSQYQFIGDSEMNYYLETTILEVLKPYLSTKPVSIYKNVLKTLNEKEYGKSLDYVDSIIKTGRKDIDLVIYKAMILANLNRNQEVIEYLKKNIKSSEIEEDNIIFASYFFILGYSYLTLGKFKNAYEMANKSLKIFSENALSHALKGMLLGYNKIYSFDADKADTENGIEDIDRAIDLESYDFNKARFYQLKSQILLELNNQEEALESIDRAINLSPKTLDYYNSKNRILIYFDQFDEVLKILDKLISEFPEGERNLKIKKAYILREKKDLESGLALIDELIEKYPDDNNLILNKAYWLQYLEEEEKVREIMQKLIDKVPNKGIYHDTFGEILMNFEDYENAAAEFEKAVKLDSEEWYINQTFVKLGICYREMNKLELAIEYLMKGKEITNRCYCDLDTKRRWLSIADLFLAEIAEMEEYY
ncbi:MAG: hypothetical protein ACFFEN_03440 [Candidatus Thorarchaeota archaeon]